MTENNNISERVKAMIGQESCRSYLVTERDIRQFKQAIGETDDEPVLMGDNFADSEGMEAPPLFCQVFTYGEQPLSMLLPDGSPYELNIPIDAKRTVGGASEYKVYRRLRAGDKVNVTAKLKDVYTKRGKSGLLYFIEIVTSFTDQNDEPVACETATYIKRR